MLLGDSEASATLLAGGFGDHGHRSAAPIFMRPGGGVIGCVFIQYVALVLAAMPTALSAKAMSTSKKQRRLRRG